MVGLDVNTEKTKYIVMCRHQSTGQNHNLLIVNKSYENVVKCKYSETKVKNQNYIHEVIRSD
jgi:hypothetical protein